MSISHEKNASGGGTNSRHFNLGITTREIRRDCTGNIPWNFIVNVKADTSQFDADHACKRVLCSKNGHCRMIANKQLRDELLGKGQNLWGRILRGVHLGPGLHFVILTHTNICKLEGVWIFARLHLGQFIFLLHNHNVTTRGAIGQGFLE